MQLTTFRNAICPMAAAARAVVLADDRLVRGTQVPHFVAVGEQVRGQWAQLAAHAELRHARLARRAALTFDLDLDQQAAN